MITSSKFFNKSFFTLQNLQHKLHSDELSPWANYPSKGVLQGAKVQSSVSYTRPQQDKNKGYEISKKSSKRYIEQKLRAKSLLSKSKQLTPKKSIPKFFTIQQKQKQAQQSKVKPTKTIQSNPEKKIKRRKYQNMFPQISIHQYNQLKAEGSGIYSNNSIDEILEKRKNRRKLLEDFGNLKTENQRKSPRFVNKSCDEKNFVSGKFVCAIKNPHFSINGLPTRKLMYN